MEAKKRNPEITVFAGPNGSGKSTIFRQSPHGHKNYINADDIASVNHCDNLMAAQMAEAMRNQYIDSGVDFSFETVLSTDRNLALLRRAKKKGYFIRGIFVLTASADLNVVRVISRVMKGGHPVPEDKIRSRYQKSLRNIPEFVSLCDVCHIYDNTQRIPKRIFRKRREETLCWTTQEWGPHQICNLVNMPVRRENGKLYYPKKKRKKPVQ